MKQLAVVFAITALASGYISALLLKFLPIKYTLTAAAQAITNKNIRHAAWGLPIHMLSTIGKSLYVSFWLLFCLGILVIVLV